jgi:hypothetical protein
MDAERRCLVQLSLVQEVAILLCRLVAAAGVELATLAHEVLMGALRCMLEAYGTSDALPALDDARVSRPICR